MTAFDDLALAFASFFGIDTGSAGAILGLIMIIVLAIALVWLLGEDFMVSRLGLLVFAGIVAFDEQVGWWQPWTIVFIVILVVFAMANPFAEKGGMMSG